MSDDVLAGLLDEYRYGDYVPPGLRSIREAGEVLRIAAERGLPLRRLAAMANGGMVMIFGDYPAKYGDIECYNDGALLRTLTGDDVEPDIAELDPAEKARAVDEVAAYLGVA